MTRTDCQHSAVEVGVTIMKLYKYRTATKK